MKLLGMIAGLVFLLAACSPTGKQAASVSVLSIDSVTYAEGFEVKRFADYTSVDVRDPWDSTRILQRYLLVDRDRPVPADLPKGTIVKIPVNRVVVYTSVHAAILEQLQEAERIIGVCEPRYMDSPVVQDGVRSGRIADLGEATAPNVEKMIEIGAELIIASPFQNSSYGPVEKIGVPILEAADYMEPLPLGRTEWIRFYGLLFHKEALADSIFRATEQRYLYWKERVAHVAERPTVFVEKRYGSSWFMPAGDSYIAHLLEDAGAEYVFGGLPGAGSTPLAFETVYAQACHADLWLMKYNRDQDMRYADLQAEYAPYANFDAFQHRQIFTCNTGKVPYYEEFPLHPDYLLQDYVWIFHPDRIPDYKPRYYRRMAE
ncbi:MAG: ABC transporter substrate-binding protein [Parabacteroides sp.]